MISMEEARTRVARGAAHLDNAKPGWERRIDVGTLALNSACFCVLGQLRAWQGLHLDSTDPTWGAFTLDSEMFCTFTDEYDERERDYGVLQDAWIEAIAARLHPDSVAPLAPAEAVSA